ncbi:hypothetical protein [uncultured Algibacter sp.]|uniref:hypothetical protein n=1 Tax=uncultured Algibacter sp. TaxID=298659 RepID=UPI0026219AFE|nr:hypothetical protein [uncultured Algibacter sp.]
MAPIKFENDIRDKLEERRLQPSTNAWSKLSDRLDNEDAKSNKKPYWWLGIAASVIGVLFMVSQFLNKETKVSDAPVIVETPEVIEYHKNTPTIKENKFEGKDEVNKNVEKQIVTQTRVKKLIPAKREQQLVNVLKQPKAPSKKEESNQVITLPITPKKTLSFEEQKIEEVVAQVQSLKSKKSTITNAEIDALLKAAQKEIKHNRLYNQTTGLVDANALLQDVEEELDQTFRSKVFEALKSSFNSVKTAVVQRNE